MPDPQSSPKERAREHGPLTIGGTSVAPGERTIVDLPVAELYTHTELTMPVHVLNGRRPGPTLFITAAVHGDELNGVEIIQRLLSQASMKRLRGRVLAVPIVNVFGFINRSRYLPDRRDLNRSFPGREQGSIAARMANLVTREIIGQSDYGIDLHTGAVERTNLPQIRADLNDKRLLGLAQTFGTPVLINASLRDGSLRECASQHGVPVLVYEGGQALMFDELSIRAGVRGIGRVMRSLGMLPERERKPRSMQPMLTNSTSWVRAPQSGIIRTKCWLGERVSAGQPIATVSDPFGGIEVEVCASSSGLIIGRSTSPLAHEGDALFHIASFDDTKGAQARVDEWQDAQSVEPKWG